MAQAKKENGLENTQPQTRAPSRGGWAIDERADMNLVIPEGVAPEPDNHRDERGQCCPQNGQQGAQEDVEEHFAHGSGSRENEIGEPANPEPRALASYLRGWLDLYQRHQNRICPGLGNELVHEDAGPLDAGSLSHDLPLRRICPIPDNGTAGQNESPEAASEGNDGR